MFGPHFSEYNRCHQLWLGTLHVWKSHGVFLAKEDFVANRICAFRNWQCQTLLQI